MHVVPLTAAFEDARGAITDLVTGDLSSATILTTVKGAIRGNHWHEETVQWTYVISGRLRVVTRRESQRGMGQSTDEAILEAGELMFDPPREHHAWEALEDCTVLVLTHGPRSGRDYEKDTFRLPDAAKLI